MGHQWAGQAGKSDLVAEAVYISARTGVVHKRVIIAEVDHGDDKTISQCRSNRLEGVRKSLVSITHLPTRRLRLISSS